MQNATMFEWNDLRYLLAVSRAGSTTAAGRALGVNQSTVQRRLAELERCVGLPLVKRDTAGYTLTEFGLSLLPHAESVERAVLELERHVEEARRATTGVVRVTGPEPLVYRITQSSLLDRFHARYPGLRVEFVMSDRYLDLMKGDADIALRSGDTDEGELVGRRIGDSIWAVYASRDYIERNGKPERIEDLERHPLAAFDESMSGHRLSTWLARVAPGARIVARNNSVLGLVYSVKSGVGLSPLPIALGDAEPDLVRVLGPIPELARIWRVLASPEQRKTPRVAAFFDFIVEEIETLRPILTG
ncbi:MAG: LysR family transcriptional regulator [Betaproteobacteria bacterium]